MASKPEPDQPVFDRARCAAVLTRALQLPGGGELVTTSLGGLPGVVVTRRRARWFGRPITCVRLGHWRYCPIPMGRLEVEHIVDGVLLAEHQATPAEAGAHITMALSLYVSEYGDRVVSDIVALLAGLEAAAD